MFLGVSNTIDEESKTELEFVEGNCLQFVLYCANKKKFISSISKGSRRFTGDITKAKMFNSRSSAEEKMKYFQMVIPIANTEKGIILA
jgi:hypothetical protein